MAKDEVDEQTQGNLFVAGVLNNKKFAVAFKDVDELRASPKDAFGIDTSYLREKGRFSVLLVAWGASRTHSTKLAEVEGEAIA